MISLHPRTRIEAGDDGTVLVGHPWGVHRARGDYLGLRRLVDQPVEPDTLDDTELRFVATFPFLVVHHIGAMKLVPLGLAARPLEPAAVVQLSRFAVLRAEAGRLVLESPLALYRAELDPALGGLITSFVEPQPLEGDEIVRGLAMAGLLGGPDDEELRTWEFHDLLFHTRSRGGRHDRPIGGTYPHRDAFPGPKEVTGAAIDLPSSVPDAFSEVLNARKSTRTYSGMSLDQLGKFLHRALHGRRYPSAGASYELEVYPVVRRVEGLPRGVYHYDQDAHVLRLVNPDLDELARRPADFEDPPDVLLVITARFRRVSWKYSSIAYATTLRNVGVLYQQFYLVAASLGLGACAIGSGDVAATERVLGVPFTEESTVGEFGLGGPDV
jgi:SagB-type dehydrogenase family enzyme